MRKISITIFLIAFGAITVAWLLGSCRRDNPNSLSLLQQEIPEGFPDPVYRFQDNPLSDEGIALGRKLFYDGRLSKDGNFPCASCHQQIAGFGTYEHDRSHGYNGSHTLRNAPGLFNLAWQTNFHWDGEFRSFTDEAAHPITGHLEMAEDFNAVIDKLQQDPEYREQFRNVFRTDFISPQMVTKALAQFTGTLISANSRYDRYKKGTSIYNAQQLSGYQLFQSNCAGCHPEPMFTDYTFHNTGLPVDDFLDDYGRMMITGQSADSLMFRTPTLRNVFISSNYMHDGRFNTLAQCINHYRTGIQQSATLDPVLTSGIALTNQESLDIVEFLKTLTDSAFLKDTRYNRP